MYNDVPRLQMNDIHDLLKPHLSTFTARERAVYIVLSSYADSLSDGEQLYGAEQIVETIRAIVANPETETEREIHELLK